MRRGLMLLVGAALLVLAPPSAAQQDGVFVDPDSPSGREYSNPLEEARRAAGGGAPGKVALGERTAPLFGEGVEPVSGTATAEQPAREKQDGRAQAAADVPEDERADAAPAVAASGGSSGDGSQDVLIVGTIGLGALAIGAAAGVAARRRLTSG